MRRNSSIERLLGSIPVLFFASGAWAADPGTAASWNDQHMRSNFAARAHESAARPPIQIGDAEGADTQVREQLLSINPHGWKPGVGSFGSAQRGASSRSFSSASGAHPMRGIASVRTPSWSHGMRGRASR